jgi:hypothetical protein
MTSINGRVIAIFLTIAAAIVVGSCAETQRQTATGKGRIRGIAAIVDAPDTVFRIEEKSLGTLRYKAATSYASYDDLEYNFNFDIQLPTDTDLTRLASQFVDVIADTDYTIILTGTFANPQTIVWEDAPREWTGTETVFEPTFAHFSPALGDVDVYFAPPGTPPVLGNAVATLANGERVRSPDVESALYEVILTAAGNPSNILYTSEVLQGTERTRPVFAIFDADPSITSPVAMHIVSEGGGSLGVPDPAFPAQLRFYHTAFGVENVDFYFDDDFGNRIFADVAFGELTTYTGVSDADTKVTLTATGNTGAILHENGIVIPPGSKQTIVLAGDPATLFFNQLKDEPRPLAVGAALRVANFAINNDFTKAYLLEPGTEINAFTEALFGGLSSQADTGYFSFEQGPFEMTITDFNDIVPIAPPVTLDLAVGEILEIAILDTVDPAVFELTVYDRQ